MSILLADASDGFVVMALQLTMMEQCISRLLSGGVFRPAYTTEGPLFFADGLSEAAKGSPLKPHITRVRRLRRNSW